MCANLFLNFSTLKNKWFNILYFLKEKLYLHLKFNLKQIQQKFMRFIMKTEGVLIKSLCCQLECDWVTFKKGQPLVQLVLKGSSYFADSGSNKSYSSHLFCLMLLYFGERYTVTTVYAVIAFLGILPVYEAHCSQIRVFTCWEEIGK